MTDDVSVQFHVIGEGWANIELRIGAQKHVIAGVSDTTDALGDLVRAALIVATGGQSRVSFDGEQVETRLVLESLLDTMTEEGPVAITVLSFADIYANEPNEKGQKEFYGDCGALAFAQAVLACAKGRDPNLEWGHYRYPLSAVRALETALATRDTPTRPQT